MKKTLIIALFAAMPVISQTVRAEDAQEVTPTVTSSEFYDSYTYGTTYHVYATQYSGSGDIDLEVDASRHNVLFTGDDTIKATSLTFNNPVAANANNYSQNSHAFLVGSGELVLDNLGNLGNSSMALGVGCLPGETGTLTISGGTQLETTSYYNRIGTGGRSGYKAGTGVINIDGPGSTLKTQQITLGINTSMSAADVDAMVGGQLDTTKGTEGNFSALELPTYKIEANKASTNAERLPSGIINVTNGGSFIVGEGNSTYSVNKLQIDNGGINVDGAGSTVQYAATNGLLTLACLSRGTSATTGLEGNGSILATNGGKFTMNSANSIVIGQDGLPASTTYTTYNATVCADGEGSEILFATTGNASTDIACGASGSAMSIVSTIEAKNGGHVSFDIQGKSANIAAVSSGGNSGSLTANFMAEGEGSLLEFSAKDYIFIGYDSSGTASADRHASFEASDKGVLKVDAAVYSYGDSLGLAAYDGASLEFSGLIMAIGGSALTVNAQDEGTSLSIDTVSLYQTTKSANINADANTLHIGNIEVAFDSTTHTDASEAAVITYGYAEDLTKTAWSFSLTDAAITKITNDNTKYWLADMTGLSVQSYYDESTNQRFYAMEGEYEDLYSGEKATGTYIGTIQNAAGAVITNTSGSVTAGKDITAATNNASVVTGETNKVDLYVNVATTATTAEGGSNGKITVDVTKDATTTQHTVRDAYVYDVLTLERTDLEASGKVKAAGATINLTNSNITSTDLGSVVNSTIKGTGTLTNLTISNSTLIAGNSPGVMELTGSSVVDGTLRFYVGSEAANSLKDQNDAVSLTLDDVVVTSGFVINSGTVLSGDITLELWSNENTLGYETGRIFNTLGDSLQLFKAGDGVELATALGSANFILGDTFGAATTWGWDTSQLASTGKVYVVVPEPATATLSLLALAGLCARRRRK